MFSSVSSVILAYGLKKQDCETMDEIDLPNVDVLILDRDEDSALTLANALGRFIKVNDVDYAGKVSHALEYLLEVEYIICMINAKVFKKADLRCLIEDSKKICDAREYPCQFFLVYDPREGEIEFAPYRSMGFFSTLKRPYGKQKEFVYSDIAHLKRALATIFHSAEVSNRSDTIERTMTSVLKEIDRVAKAKKRGRERKFNRTVIDYVTDLTSFDHEVLDTYFHALMRETGVAKPQEVIKLDLPRNLQGDLLPGVNEDGDYTGTSGRVYERLLVNYGVREDDTPSDDS